MSEVFSDRLLNAIDRTGAPVCVGIDPIFDLLPDAVAGDARDRGNPDREASIDAIFAFTTAILRIVAPHVPCVKFQSAYFEKYLWEGVEAYYSLIAEAVELGLLVIGDVKRGDIGTTASAYAAAHLANTDLHEAEDVVIPDAITVNPFLGLDTLEPFIKTAVEFDKGLFVLVRTSNPGSGDLEDAPLADGRTFSEMLADKLAAVAADPKLMGSRGYSSLGAVVGATQPQRCSPSAVDFLIPFSSSPATALGRTADMTRAAFTDGHGALVSASRSILYAHREPKYAERFGDSWERCVEQAVIDMKADLGRVLRP